MMFESSIQTLEQFKAVLCQLPEACYSRPIEVLSNATIGQHSRHVIELYSCLIAGYEGSMVCYDKRQRNKKIEHEVAYAIEQLESIQAHLKKPNKPLQVAYELAGQEVVLESNYNREVMYNLEHAIHHHALIKVGILDQTDIIVPESFGVAPSTMQYRKVCVQ